MTCRVDPHLEASVERRVRRSVADGIARVGMGYDADGSRNYMSSVRAAGRAIWDRDFPSILGRTLFELISELGPGDVVWRRAAPRVLGFGDYIGGAVSSLTGAREPATDEACRSTAMLNLLLGLADKLIDEGDRAGQDADVVDRVIGHGVLAMVSLSGSLAERAAAPGASPGTRFFLLTMDAYLNSLTRAREACGEADTWLQFVEQGDRLIDAESAARVIPVAPGSDLAAARVAIRTKNVLSFTLLVLNALLLAGGGRGRHARDLKVAATSLGELFGLVDDLTDVIIDTRAGRWNECLVRLFEQDGATACRVCGRGCCPALVLMQLNTSGVIEELGYEVGARLVTAAALVRDRLGIHDGALHLMTWTNSWLRLY